MVLPGEIADDQGSVEINDAGQLVLKIDPDPTAASTDDDLTTIELEIAALMENEETKIAAAKTHVQDDVRIHRDPAVRAPDLDRAGTMSTATVRRRPPWADATPFGPRSAAGSSVLAGWVATIRAPRKSTSPRRSSRLREPTGTTMRMMTPTTSWRDVTAANALEFTATQYPRDGDEADDVKGLKVIDELLDALSSADNLEDALDDGGDLPRREFLQRRVSGGHLRPPAFPDAGAVLINGPLALRRLAAGSDCQCGNRAGDGERRDR